MERIKIMKCNAIILAAGYGSRLAPITNLIPKPLVPVGDRTLLENILISLDSANVANFAINSYHLGTMLESAVKESAWSSRVSLFPEKEILGTGGPLINAKELLSDCDAFILHNGDIFTDLDFSKLIEHHSNSKSDVTMVMIDGPENKVAVDSSGRVVDILGKLGVSENGAKKLTYAGISIFSPKIFHYLPNDVENCSIITAILNLMRDPQNLVSAYYPDGDDLSSEKLYWNDLGTIEKLIDAKNDILKDRVELNSIADKSIPMPLTYLPHPGASDRHFFRFNHAGMSLISDSVTSSDKIVMCGGGDSKEFERFIKVSKFLSKHNLGAAKLDEYSLERNCVIMEDLGNDILFPQVGFIFRPLDRGSSFNTLKSNITDLEKAELYKSVISWLVKFQSSTYEDILKAIKESNSDEKLGVRIFDYDYLRWETDYFANNYLVNYCGVSKSVVESLSCEFRKLAEESLRQPQLLIHRDFQSQNILFKNNSVRIVDFQGARVGHIAYDLMSLLKDPYVALSEDLRSSLIDFYFEEISKTTIFEKIPFTRQELAYFATIASLQRNMQALGAYAYLGLEKGKIDYLQYIPQGLEYLKSGLSELNNSTNDFKLPKLSDII